MEMMEMPITITKHDMLDIIGYVESAKTLYELNLIQASSVSDGFDANGETKQSLVDYWTAKIAKAGAFLESQQR